jgi:alkylation response protein AidB-like acyl-CoA dehydrogenase
MLVPVEFGGLEVEPLTLLRVLEEVAQADGATGWNLMISNSAGFIAPRLPPAGAEAIFGRNPDAVIAGSPRPEGQAHHVTGGYRLTGRWPFASGIRNADWLMLGGAVVEDGVPRRTEAGGPETRLLFLPAAEGEILDNWHVIGLRGTGSSDVAVHDVFVPAEHSISGPAQPRDDGRLFAMPQLSLWSAMTAAVPLGIARAAITALVEFAGTKTPRGSAVTLRERATVQADVARAEMLMRAGRAVLYETVVDIWRAVQARQPISPEQRVLVRAAAAHAADNAVQAVDLMYSAGGTTSIYTSSPLERCTRDVRVTTQHFLVSRWSLETAGRVLLGLEPDTPFL